MKAIVLAGGFATRLRPLTLTKPKALLPILNKPLLDWIIESLRDSGIREIVLSVRYLADMIEKLYGDGSRLGVSLLYARELKPLGDAGPLKLVDELYGLDTTFVVIYGDVFSDIDIEAVLEFHRRKGGIATLTLVEVEDPSRYGVALLDEDYRVRDFVEKPERGKAPSNLANAGIYVFEPEVLKYIPSGKHMKIARELIPKLISAHDVYGYVHRGLWNDIGVPEDYLKSNIDALNKYYPSSYVDPSAKISESATIIHPVYIGKNVVVENDCIIGPNVILGNDVKIGRGTRIINSVLFNNVIVEGYGYIEGAIVADRAYIGRWVRIERGAILGDEVVVNDCIHIASNVIVLPFKEITESIEEQSKIVL